MQEADKHLDFLREPNIFDLDLIDNGLIAGTRIETFYEMKSMLDELLRFEDLISHANYKVTQEDLNNLLCKYPLLEFTKRAPGPGDPYSGITRRMSIWALARFRLHLPASEKETEATKAFFKFTLDYEFLDSFDFLEQQPSAEPEEYVLLVHYALDELWALTQRLKLRPLTHAQEADRQALERFVASHVKLNLIDIEHEKITRHMYNSGQSAWLHLFRKERKTATKIVDERIARGDWQ
ncbi:hypothetical protein MMC29_006023, partial [Sticta canariensis]|nr:hypothetical protein [Sticta canariensis]